MNVENTLAVARFKSFVLILFFMFILLPWGWGQEVAPFAQAPESIQFGHLTREDGLPSDHLNVIIQDSRGFLWFGTTSGLIRYDGYQLKVFKNDPKDSLSLSFNNISTIYEDRSGTLWVGTSIGLNKLDREAENFQIYRPNPNDSLSLNDYVISAIYEDENGLFWVGTWTGGLNLMDREKGTFIHYKPDPNNLNGPISNGISVIVADPVNTERLWISGQLPGGFHGQFNTSTRTFIPYPNHLAGRQVGGHGTITSISISQKDQVWLGTRFGLDLFDRKNEGFITYNHLPDDPQSLSHNNVNAVLEDKSGVLWVGTNGGGLNRFDGATNTFYHYRPDPSDPKSLGSDKISSIIEDQSGMLWIGTSDRGISYTNRRKQKFQHIKHEPGLAGSLNDNAVSAIYQDRNGVLWIGTFDGGLNYFDHEINGFNHYKHEPGNPNSLSKNYVWSICEDQEGMMWIGTNSEGLNRFDRTNGQFKSYQSDPENPGSIANDYVTAVLIGHTGKYWIATLNGLQQFDPQTEKFQNFTIIEDNPRSKKVMCLYEDQSGMLWIATEAGLSCLDQKSGAIRHFYPQKNYPNSLSRNITQTVLEDASGAIWVGTMAGLNRMIFEEEDKLTTTKLTINQYTEKEGLPSNNIAGILEDNLGRLWISSRRGLTVFRNPQHDENTLPDFKNYEPSDGIQAYEFHSGAYFKNAKGEMFFGGPSGFNRFQPETIQDNPFVPPVRITSFEKYNLDLPEQGPVPIKGVTEKEQVVLSHKNNIFSISFAALSYRERHKNQYAYQLEGFNDHWIQLGTKNQVTFTNLDPGNYLFRVKGSNNDGIWNEEGVSLAIIVRPPWWQTWWAYLLYVIVFFIAILRLRSYELNRQRLKHELRIKQMAAEQERRESEKLKELDRMKSRFFANISHEFRTPLALILGPLDNLLAGKFEGNIYKHYKLMKRNAQRLLRLINQLLDLSKLEAGKLELQINREELVGFLKFQFYTFESLAVQNGIDLQFKPEREKIYCRFDKEKLEQVIVNLLSNAFKFTSEGGLIELEIAFPETATEKQSFVKIIVRDTGQGITEDQLPFIFDRFYHSKKNVNNNQMGIGIGLSLTKELVELHGGKIEVNSQPGKGAAFIVFLPLEKDWKKAMTSQKPIREKPIFQDESEVASPQKQNDLLPALSEEVKDRPIVLLVEDNPEMREFIAQQLQNRYRVFKAENGKVGFDKAIKIIPDLIVSDVMMPEVDGYQLCEKLKSDERTSHIPVILLTAKSSAKSKIEGLELGADDYLTKPFQSIELLVRINNLIVQRRKLRQYFGKGMVMEPSKVRVSSLDEQFLRRLTQLVEAHIADANLKPDMIFKEMAMSRAQLYRKLRALTDQSVGEFIQIIRLKRAADLLTQNAGTIAEIAFEVGFTDPSYFTKVFRKQFGCAPSAYRV